MPIRLPPQLTLSGEQLVELAQAVQALERLFPDYDVKIERDHGPFAPFLVNKNESIRDKVISAVKTKHLTAAEIAATTGIDKKQVRGVLNSPDIKSEFVKLKANGATRYRYKDPPNPSFSVRATDVDTSVDVNDL